MAALPQLARLRPARLAALAHRFARAAEVLGPAEALKVVVGARRSRSLQQLRVPGWSRPFWFRGWADAGILGHLFMPGFEVVPAPGDEIVRIIDGGANIGGETLRFRLFHPKAHIVSVEAARENFEVLSRNFAGDDQVELVHAGLWSSEARLRVEAGPSFEGFRVHVVTGDAPHDIDAVSIDGLLDARGWDEVDILKLDVEGAEWELFGESAARWIERVKVLVFECPDADHPGTTARIFKAFGDLDVTVRIAGEKVCVVRRETGWRVDFRRALPG